MAEFHRHESRAAFDLGVLEGFIALPARHIEPEVAVLNMSTGLLA
jgi:hypothetical protein